MGKRRYLPKTNTAVVPATPKTPDVAALRTACEIVARNQYAASLGLSFNDARDMYTALGYNKTLLYSDYWNMFRRGRLGRRVISAPVESTWRGDLGIYEEKTPKGTQFEKDWEALNKKLKITAKFARLDKLVGLGEFGLLLLGFDDATTLDTPLTGKHKLIYVQPYSFNNCAIVEWETDETNERYGLPKVYTIDFQTMGATVSTTAAARNFRTLRVHYSRVIHVAEGLLDNDVFGTPRLESSFNSLNDLEKIAGGSAEMYWQGALGGKAFASKEGATIDSQSAADMTTQIDEYVHGLRRYLRLQNMEVHDLSPQTSDPRPAIDAQLDMISGDTGIPKRILTGSERGELASTQDESNWLNRIRERRTQYAEPQIVRPVIDLLISVGAIAAPQSGEYSVCWPDLWASSEVEQAQVAKTKSEALAAYTNAVGADQIMPVDFFLEEIMKLTPDQLERIKAILASMPEEEALPEEEEEETLPEEEM